MKKHQFAILTGILLSVFVVMGCGNPAAEPEPTSNPNEVTVTFDAGTIGRVYDSKKSGYYSTVTKTISKGNTVEPPELIIDEFPQQYVYDLKCYYKSGTEVAFDFTQPINENVVLIAQYEILKPTNLKAVTSDDGKELTVSFDHKAFGKNIANYNFELKVLSDGDVLFTKTESITETKELTFNNLTTGKKLDVEIKVKYNGEESEAVSTVAYTASQKTDILMLMYMDADNNLNDPLFIDLNEVEYGLSKLSAEKLSGITILALFDGWQLSGNGKDKPTYGFPETKLLKVGPDADPISDVDNAYTSAGLTLSSNTIDLSDSVSWLSSGEVNMGDKETFRNFLTYALSNYKSDKIIIQFSNHGGGPRSYAPGTIRLSYKKRAMCWDDTSGPDAFLKSSEVSSVLKEVGFNSNNQIELIVEDVCLGGALEEAYEYADCAKYVLASPNNVPGNGLNYEKFIASFNRTSDISTVASDVCKQYITDYGIYSNYNFTNEKFEKLCKENEIDLTEYDTTEKLDNLKMSLSINSSMNTISLIKTANLKDVVKSLDKVVNELLSENGKKACTKFWYDTKEEAITSVKNTDCIEISRADLLKAVALRPMDAINYQGTYSWLYDLGWACEIMYYYAGMENWSTLKNHLDSVVGNLYTSLAFSWRDGFFKPTYSSYYCAPGGHGWLLEGSSYIRVYYGLTISGETMELEYKDGEYYLTDGKYPSWYTELKFGQDCKWNDLLKAWFPQN